MNCNTLIIFIILFKVLFFANSVFPENKTVSDNRRERCLEILHDGLSEKSGFWVNVHAAEALLYHSYSEGVKENFVAKADTAGPKHRIGVWRVLAKASEKDAVSHLKYQNLVLDAFLDYESPDRLHALETLGKLCYAKSLTEIVRIAETGNGKIIGYARWILANSGEEEDEMFLAKLLSSGDKDLYGTAAYALRFFIKIRPETYTLLKKCPGHLPADAEYLVYVLSAIYVHAPPGEKAWAKENLLALINGNKNEKYEICEAIGINGDISDVNILEELLEDPEIDVQVSAANALLRIERRQSTGLHFFDWIIIALYAAAMTAVGFYYVRRTKTGDDYLLGGRKINSVAAGISLMATMVSAIAFLGTTGETIKHGPAFAIFYIMAYPINYFVIGFIIIPIYMKYRFTSAYELLEKPLGRGVRLFASILSQFGAHSVGSHAETP